MGGGTKTRLVLVDSGANILYAETSTNITNVRNEGVQLTDINGVSVSSGVGKLPPMVLNTGHVPKLTEDCAISKIGDSQLHAGRLPRTIITPKHLNEIGISVCFANGTAVLLLQTDTLASSGKVIQQKQISNGLTLIRVSGTVPGKTHEEGYTTPQVVNTKVSFPGCKRAKLKADAIEVTIKTKRLNRSHLPSTPTSSKQLVPADVYMTRSKFTLSILSSKPGAGFGGWEEAETKDF